jgi:NAD(P)-dependent dehydrogenase (short-subunit alcohol dehydrogenase family)
VLGFSEATQMEVGQSRVQASALCPGFVDTPARDPGGGAPDPTAMMTPEDIAETVRFLLRVSPACCVPRIELVRPGERMT